MSHRGLLFGLIIVYLTKGIFADQDSGNSCSNKDHNDIEVEFGEDVTIACPCEIKGNTTWLDSNCNEILPSSHIIIISGNVTIKSLNRSDSLYYCRVQSGEQICQLLTRITAKEKVPPSSGSGAAVAVIIILAVVIVVLLCFLKKNKARASLCIRDTFKANDGRDGKDYDAYISTGFTEIDRRFIEQFITEVLQKKCGYKLVLDNNNIFPKLDYSPKMNGYIHRCRRLVVVFSPSYMTHDWCMYCFNEGLRKIVDLNIPTVFVITDHTMLSELQAHAEVIAHIPQILLTQYQTSKERQRAIERIRQEMPPPMRQASYASFRKPSGMRSPIISDAESIHKSDYHLDGSPTEEGTEYTFPSPPQQIAEEIEREYDEALEEPGPDEYVTSVRTGQEIDPGKVKVNEYGARKDFYSLTMTEEP